jgi:alcohol dehydrogenase class IV
MGLNATERTNYDVVVVVGGGSVDDSQTEMVMLEL